MKIIRLLKLLGIKFLLISFIVLKLLLINRIKMETESKINSHLEQLIKNMLVL